MRGYPAKAAFWLVAAFVPTFASQLLRLHRVDPVAWLFWDYAGRIGTLAVLMAIPSARIIAFQRQELRFSQQETAVKIIVALVVADFLLRDLITRSVNAAIPGTILGIYPAAHGWLRAFDLVAGLALVACHEEIVFRRVAHLAVRSWLGDGWMMVVATSLLFAAYHWWSGAGNISSAFLFGMALMLAYRQLNALWPVVIAHYLMDIVAFS